jgi:uncharacterized delta-60 repeat protein
LRFTVLGGAFLLAACGGDSNTTVNNPPPPAAATAPVQPVVAKIEVLPIPMTTTDSDRFLGVTTAPNGDVYAAGFITVSGDTRMAVARFDALGNLDPAFGTAGIASVNAVPSGNTSELARGVVVQSTGKVVIVGAGQHDVSATPPANLDTDVFLARFNTDGTLDTTFGTAGVARVDLSTGVPTSPTAFRGDSVWGLTLLPNDQLLISGGKVANVGGRTDIDYAAARLTKDGVLDPTFGTGGIATVDVANGGNDQPRTAVVQPDGKIVVTGHTNVPAPSTLVLAVLYRLNPNGTFDATFNGTCAPQAAPCAPGVVAAAITTNIGEAYDVGLQGDKLVINGYGNSTAGATVDVLSARFSSSGVLDTSYGTNGVTAIDVAGQDDRSRALKILSDQGVLIVGSGKPDASNMDGLVALLTPNGQRNTAFGTNGVKLVDLGGTLDSFFAVALSPDGKTAYAVGYKGVAAQTALDNDDARIVVIPLSAGGN